MVASRAADELKADRHAVLVEAGREGHRAHVQHARRAGSREHVAVGGAIHVQFGERGEGWGGDGKGGGGEEVDPCGVQAGVECCREAEAEAQDGDVVDGAHVPGGFQPLAHGGVEDGGPPGQVAFQGLEALGLDELAGEVAFAGLVQLGGIDFDDVCTRGFQFAQRVPHDLCDGGRGSSPQVGSWNADAEAGYGPGVRCGSGSCCAGRGRGWSGRLGAGPVPPRVPRQRVDRSESIPRIFHRVGEQSHRVQGLAQGDDARGRPPARGVAVSHDARRRGRNPDRSAGVAPQRDHGRSFPQTHARSG